MIMEQKEIFLKLDQLAHHGSSFVWKRSFHPLSQHLPALPLFDSCFPWTLMLTKIQVEFLNFYREFAFDCLSLRA